MVGIVTFLCVLINVLVTSANKKKEIQANVISKARIEWIQKVREYLSEYVAIAFELYIYCNDDIENLRKNTEKFDKDIIQLHIVRTLLILNLDPDNEYFG